MDNEELTDLLKDFVQATVDMAEDLETIALCVTKITDKIEAIDNE